MTTLRSSYPLLTVITPSFNQAEYLEKTIQSVLRQNYPYLQYIVIDGGSTDGSIDIIKKYEHHIDYWCSENDQGQSDAINKGLRMAKGDWVAFQNSDDVYLPESFEKFSKFIYHAKTPVDIIYGNLLHIDSRDNVLDVQLTIPTGFHGHFCQMQTQNQSLFWRRDLLDRHGYLDDTMFFSFDFEFFCRVLKKGAKVKHIDEPLGAFRHQDFSKSSTARTQSHKDHLTILKRHGSGLERYTPQKLRTAIFKFYKSSYCIAHGNSWYLFRHRKKNRCALTNLQSRYSNWFASLNS